MDPLVRAAGVTPRHGRCGVSTASQSGTLPSIRAGIFCPLMWLSSPCGNVASRVPRLTPSYGGTARDEGTALLRPRGRPSRGGARAHLRARRGQAPGARTARPAAPTSRSSTTATRTSRPPRTIGHEIAGEVVEVGADVNATYGVSLAGRATAPRCIAAVPCGECHECRKGWMAVCQNQTSVGYQYDGGFAEYMIVPEAGAQGRRPQPDPRQRRLRRGLGRRAVRLRDQRPGAARHRGGRHRRRLRRRPDRLHAHPDRPRRPQGRPGLPGRRERRAAARCPPTPSQPDETIDGSEVDVVERVMELTGGRGADVVITATAANVTQEQAIAMAARNGRISFFGGLPKTDPYDQAATPTSCTTASCTSTAPTARRPSTTSGRWSTSPPARSRSRT